MNKVQIANVALGEEEIAAATEALRSGQLRQGAQTKAFEEEFAQSVGARHAIAVSSGSAALHIAYLALLNPGDEVLVPVFSHISTASMVHFAAAKPVFCDLNPDTFTIDIKDARKRITDRTRAIAPVHLFGNACNTVEVQELCASARLRIIWDAAQAHGTEVDGTSVGALDDVVCYSFYATKNITTGEGGMILTGDTDLAERCRLLRSHGQTKKYVHPQLGFNYRMTDFQAAIGREQLKKLDQFVEKRRANAAYLNQLLGHVPGVNTPFVANGVKHSYHQYTVTLDVESLDIERDDVAAHMARLGVETGIHYPQPLHLQPAFANIADTPDLPTAEWLSQRVLSLPIHPSLAKHDLDRVAEALKTAIR